MSTGKKETIIKIIDGKPTRIRESFFIKNYIDEYNDIIGYCINISDIPFVQKIWHYVNDYPTYYLCRCGNRTSFNRNWIDGYRKSCSPKCAQSNNDVKEKRKNNIMTNYGVDNIAKVSDIRLKTEETNQIRYGASSSFQNDKVRKKWKDSIQLKYGVDHFFKTDDFKIKAKQHYLKKYGVDHQSKVDDVQLKIQNTCLDRYGVSTYLNTTHARSSIKSYNKSSYENEISEWLLSLGIKSEGSKYGIIPPLILDIYIKEYNIAIEFNGLYWHSEFFKEKDYHLNKTLKCRENGIHLIHIWEDDWNNQKEVCKSIIINKIGIIKNKIFARKCKIGKIIDHKIASKFLNDNHIQGYSRFSDCYVLYYNDEIVSMMVFGWRSTNAKREYELIRFCNKINFNIIGGASRLFKHFINEHIEITSLTSYSDISIFSGGIYSKLGFTKVDKPIPINYWWVVKGVRKHRFNYNKKKLVKMGYSPIKTEVEIMHEIGNYRIFGCGQEKWIWNR